MPSKTKPNRFRLKTTSRDQPSTKDASHRHRSTLTDVCSWEWDLCTNRISCSNELCALLGLGGEDAPHSPVGLLEFIEPKDRQTVEEGLKSAAAGSPFERQVNLLPKSGGILSVHARAIPISDRLGEVVSVIGLCLDVSSPWALDERSRNGDVLLAQAEQIANFGSWEFDVATRCGVLSTHLAHMMGTEPGALLTEAAYWESIHPDDRQRIREIAATAVTACKPFQFVARCVLPNGRLRHHFVRGLPIAGENGIAKKLIGITQDVSDQAFAEGELHRLSQQLLRARDEERRAIARDLHESTGQTLAALKMSLGRVREALPEDDERAHSLLGAAVDLAEDAIREVRTISYLMHPPLLDEAGLPSALQWYVKGFGQRSGISVRVDIPEGFGRHGQEIETTVFRIVQEALTNVHRYSGSRTATIRLSRKEGLICAEVLDEGCGLPAPTSASGWTVPLGVGIVGMRERVKQLQGSFEIESAPGKGTAVRVLLPVQSQGAETRLRREIETD
jgi:signal transduction histidine kinase